MRHCSKCQQKKPVEDFRQYKEGKYRSECFNCEAEQGRHKRAAHKVAGNKPDNCQCCGKETKNLVVDHCHNTGNFRGWLCRNCNSGIGKLGDTESGLLRALMYLQKSKVPKRYFEVVSWYKHIKEINNV